MKVFVAVHDHDPKGFTFTNEGELVEFGFECCNSESCGCDRGWSGLETRMATTLAMVEDSPLTPVEFTEQYKQSMVAAGFTNFPEGELAEEAQAILDAAAMFPVGALVRRKHNKLHTV